MREIGMALLFIMAVNLFLFSSQMAITDMAQESGEVGVETFYNFDGNVLADFDEGNYTVTQDVTGQLPSGTGQVEQDEGNIFTDTFVIMRNWLTEATGYKYLKAIVTAFPNTLKQIGLPAEMAFALGALWHAITILMIIMFLRGY